VSGGGTGGVDVRLQRRAIAAAAIVMVLFAFLGAPDVQDQSSGPASTLRSGPGGAMALFETLGALDVDTARWYRNYDELEANLPSTAALALLAPTVPLTGRDSRLVVQWVRSGGTLLYAPAGTDDTTLAELGVALKEQDADGVAPNRAGSRLVRRILGDVAPGGYEVPDSLLESDGASFAPLLATTDGRASCALVPLGAGTAIILAEAEPLTNTSIQASPTTPVVVRALLAVLAAGADGSEPTVWFDEYHHGHEGGDGAVAATWRWLSGTHGGWATLALAALGVLSIVTAGLRLGPPIPLEPPPRRSSLEHVDALASAYHESRAHVLPRSRMVDALRLDLGAADLERTLRQVESAHPELSAAVARVRGAEEGERSEELVPLADAIDQIARALRVSREPTTREVVTK
jgi:hypothetical protein